MATSFNEQFDQHGAWRREFALRLKLLAEWMKDHDLLDAAVEERLRRLENQVRSDKVMVAFVAEFSRGKSELINAIFFAGYGRRIMPASAGRTTMCPTEMGYDAEVPPCLRLLPIETRLQTQSLMEWRMVPEKWHRVDLDVNDPGQLAQAFEKVSEVRRVTVDEAKEQMAAYFERFGGIRDYLRDVVAQARQDGYTSTIEGRRRYLPDLSSDNRQLRDMAERAALNAPIQGSAADIIKRAMLDVQAGLEEHGLASRLLLQVHDELILEVPAAELEQATALLKERMGRAAELSVPLDVHVGQGRSWHDAAH